MNVHIDFAKSRGLRIDGKEYNWERTLDDGTLVFADLHTGHPFPLEPQRFLDMYSTPGRIVRLTAGRTPVLPPWRDDDERLRKARQRHFWVTHWDKEQPSRSAQGLASFIKKLTPQAIKDGVPIVAIGTLARDLRTRGTTDCRPLGAMVDRPKSARVSKFTPEVETSIAGMIEYYYRSRRCNLKDASVKFHSDLKTSLDLESKEAYPADLSIPTDETLRLRIRGSETFENVEKKQGALVANARFRGVSKGLSASRPLECVVIDGTQIDTWLVVDDGSGVPLGRPWLTVALDVHTRMVLGFHLGFGGETLDGIMSCVRDTMHPKHFLNERYPDLRHGHDGWGRSEKFMVDNAFRQVGVSFQDAMAGLGIDVEFAEIRTPQTKAVGERFFDTLNTKLFHKAPGAVPFKPDLMKKLDIEATATAVLTLSDIHHLLNLVIVDDYHHGGHSTLGMQPARAWLEGVRMHGRDIVDDLEEANRILSAYGEGVLTREGIRFKNQRFHDQVVTSRLLAALMPGQKVKSQRKGKLSSGRVLVKFKWDPEDASKIEVYNPRRRQPGYETLPNVDGRYSSGIGFQTAQIVRDYAKRENLAFESEESRLEALENIRRVMEEASPRLKGKHRVVAEGLMAKAKPEGVSRVVETQVDRLDPGNVGIEVLMNLAEPSRSDEGFAPPGKRRGGAAATRKAVATRRNGPGPELAAAMAILDPPKKVILPEPQKGRLLPIEVETAQNPERERSMSTAEYIARSKEIE